MLSRRLAVETAISCTPPGVLESGGKVLTHKELHHGDRFETGGYIFKYDSGAENDARANSRGVNILDGKF